MRNQIKLGLISFAILLLSAFLFWQGLKPEIRKIETNPIPEKINQVLGDTKESTNSGFQENGRVTKVIDGDTIEVQLNGQLKKLRYIGIDTPETVDPRKEVQCFGREASDENKRLILGKMIYLEKDISETDKFGRLLRFVYLQLDDGNILFVNDYLVRQGFARSSTFPPDVKMSERFKLAETEARENNRGLWASCK